MQRSKPNSLVRRRTQYYYSDCLVKGPGYQGNIGDFSGSVMSCLVFYLSVDQHHDISSPGFGGGGCWRGNDFSEPALISEPALLQEAFLSCFRGITEAPHLCCITFLNSNNWAQVPPRPHTVSMGSQRQHRGKTPAPGTLRNALYCPALPYSAPLHQLFLTAYTNAPCWGNSV